MENFKKETIATESILVNRASNGMEFAEFDTAFGVITKPKGKKRSFKDHFGMAISAINHTLKTASKEDLAKYKMAISVEEQTAAAIKIVIEDEKIANAAKLASRESNKPIRFAGWSGDTSIFDKKEHYGFKK